MTNEQFSNLEVVGSQVTVIYKGIKHYVVDKDNGEGLLAVVEDDNGRCEMWKKKMLRFENCTL